MFKENDELEAHWDQEVDTYEAFLILRKHFTIRESILRYLYPYPHYWKILLWILTIFGILLCGYFIVTYGKTDFCFFFLFFYYYSETLEKFIVFCIKKK